MMPKFLRRVFGRATERRWESAKTTRLNSAQWGEAAGNRINQDIAQDVPTLWKRCQLEIARNPILEGVIETYCTDLIGPRGPAINIQSEDEKYDAELEAILTEWFASPDINRRKSIAEFLEVGIRNCWTYGDMLNLIVADNERLGPIRFSLQDIQPSRLESPMDAASRGDIILGVEVVPPMRPVAYHIAEVEEFGAYAYATGRSTRVPAANVLHWYRHIESEQVRGVPWAAVCLQVAADIRDYDDEVLDCARAAADTGVYLYADHPDAPYYETNESYQKQRRQTETLPPGWRPMQIQAQQPTTMYVDYRSERHRDLGRPIAMPLMLVRLDSSRHNYSSARFDGQRYQRGIEKIQHRLATGFFHPLIERIAMEAERAGELRPRPRRVEQVYIWPVAPHVDPTKEKEAQEIGLTNLTVSLQDALAADGKDLDTQMSKLRRSDVALRKTLGIGLIEYIQLVQRAKTEENQDDAPTATQPASAAGGDRRASRNGHGRISLAN